MGVYRQNFSDALGINSSSNVPHCATVPEHALFRKTFIDNASIIHQQSLTPIYTGLSRSFCLIFLVGTGKLESPLRQRKRNQDGRDWKGRRDELEEHGRSLIPLVMAEAGVAVISFVVLHMVCQLLLEGVSSWHK